MKKITMIIVAIACVCLICGGFYFAIVNSEDGKEKELTEVEKLIVKDLDNDYPKTPREVIKLYNRIVTCYYDEDTTKEQLGDLVDQMVKLFDAELLLVNDRETYYSSVATEVASYKNRGRYIAEAKVCDSNDVVYIDDKEKNDKVAYVTASYFIREKNDFEKTYQEFVLRKDADGKWKLVTFYLIKGEDSDDE